jgi:hypothetical protein
VIGGDATVVAVHAQAGARTGDSQRSASARVACAAEGSGWGNHADRAGVRFGAAGGTAVASTAAGPGVIEVGGVASRDRRGGSG